MSNLVTWLELTQEFGGDRHGPFEGSTIRIGSGDDMDLQISARLGVRREHAYVARKADGTHVLAPVDLSAAVYIQTTSQAIPRQIRHPTTLREGDRFMLGGPEGPAIVLVLAPLPKPEIPGGVTGPAGLTKPNGTVMAILQEIGRRVIAMFSTTGFGRMVQQFYTFVWSGQIFSPMYMVGFATLAFGGLSGMRCQQFQLEAQTAQASVSQLDQDLSECRRQVVGGGLPDLPQLTEQILGHGSWGEAIAWGSLQADFLNEMGRIVDDPATMDGMGTYLTQAGRVASFLGSDMPAPMKRTLPFLTVYPSFSRLEEGQWSVRNDPVQLTTETLTCARGAFGLGWRQATNLGIPAQFDLLARDEDDVRQPGGDIMDQLRYKIDRQLKTVDANLGLTTDGVTGRSVGDWIRPRGASSGTWCAPVTLLDTEEEKRLDLLAVSKSIKKNLGPSAKGLPPERHVDWLLARLARWELAAARHGAFVGFQPGERGLAATFADQPDLEALQPYVQRQMAKTLARSVALACLDAVQDEPMWPETLGEPADKKTCIYLLGGLQYDAL